GRITLTTDCHRAEWVDYGLAQAAQLALSCGFPESWIWRSGTFQPVPLEAWGGRGTAGGAAPCTPAQGSETLENPTLAAHFMRRGGGDDGLSFLPGANPAGRRRDLLGEVGGFWEAPRRTLPRGTLSPLEPPAQGS